MISGAVTAPEVSEFVDDGARPGKPDVPPLPVRRRGHASVAVEKFTYRSDGTIPSMNMTTQGAPQVGTLNPYVRQEAETIAWSSGVETQPASGGTQNVWSINNGDYIKVKGVAFGTGAASFTARTASAASGGTIELRLDSATGPLVGNCRVSGTGGWQTWANTSCAVTGATGTRDLYLRFTGGSGDLFNLDWWQFATGSTPATSYRVTCPAPRTAAACA
ncbi:carbohydrate-binding protein [Micromonospora haikouensis]|uniref:carbohydrate-binding protein n=1 Tax=Micromonospora haikouensis TaxID=686309 RepID=UPI00069631F4